VKTGHHVLAGRSRSCETPSPAVGISAQFGARAASRGAQRTNGLRAARHARAMAAPIVGRQEKTILFDVSKRELFTPNQGLKGLRRKLGSQFTIAVNKDAITLAVLREASVFAIVGPREKFSAAEFEAMN
jgi:hypothetical protein